MPPKSKTRIPAARIKRIMRTDDEVGKVASITPILIARAVENFLESLVKASAQITVSKDAKKVTVGHLKRAIENEPKFDFLMDKVQNVADVDEEEVKKPRKKKANVEEVKEEKPVVSHSSSIHELLN